MTIENWRKDAGLTQIALARKAGVSQGYYSRIETGACVPSMSVVRRIAHALGRDVGEVAEAIVKKGKGHVGDI